MEQNINEKAKIVGIDISKKTFDVDIRGNAKKFSNSANGAAEFIAILSEQSHCVMESTGNYGYMLADALIKAGHTVYIVNPYQIKEFARMGLSKTKTDKIDARLITRYGKIAFNEMRPYSFQSANLEAAKQILKVVAEFKQEKISLQNQLEAFDLHPYKSKDAVETLESRIKSTVKEINRLTALAEKFVTSEHKQLVKNIAGISGVSDSTSVMLTVATKAFENFDTAKQLSSYFGCCPRITESGTSVRSRGAISKIGLAEIRTRLYMCSLSAIRHNLPCKELYKRLLEKGKPKKVALMAVVNKLIRQIFAIAKSGETFSNTLEKMTRPV